MILAPEDRIRLIGIMYWCFHAKEALDERKNYQYLKNMKIDKEGNMCIRLRHVSIASFGSPDQLSDVYIAVGGTKISLNEDGPWWDDIRNWMDCVHEQAEVDAGDAFVKRETALLNLYKNGSWTDKFNGLIEPSLTLLRYISVFSIGVYVGLIM